MTALTPGLIGDYITAFLRACPTGGALWLGHDLRPSSPALAEAVRDAARAAGCDVIWAGAVPTPALALAALTAGQGAVMVTGSHIPADRNGLKFYTPQGEITKADEAAITAALGAAPKAGQGGLSHDGAVAGRYADRYRRAYAGALKGLRLGFYAQSAVGRDLMPALLRDLGAEVTALGRATDFTPVDTEAVSPATRKALRDWATAGDYDALLSTDADGDRPLLTDATGRVIPGDVLGQITGAALGAALAATPVSSNTGAETVFARVIRTRIGSPFVIAAMTGQDRAVGYEANGGFVLGFDAPDLPALMTRDAVLPLLAVLAEAAQRGGVAAVVADQPLRFTGSDRLRDVPTAQSQALIAAWQDDPGARAGFLAGLDLQEAACDTTDGLRMTATDGQIVHLRASGNAPELRCYVESDDAVRAARLLGRALAALPFQDGGVIGAHEDQPQKDQPQ